MTRTDKIATIRAACIAANPEIVELKFGALVEVEGALPERVASDPFPRPYAIQDMVFRTSDTGEEWRGSEVINIIGRPIRLADVLAVLSKASPTPKTRQCTPCSIQRPNSSYPG